MNFEPTKGKITGSLVIGFVIALINYVRQIFQGINADPINYISVILVWPISAAIIYILWSLFEKTK